MVKCLTITSYTIIISCDVFLYHVHTFEVRMHFESQIKILQDNEYKFNIICDSDQWLGIICFWEFNQFIYIEHFAINAQLRNKQYGQRTLQLLRKEYADKKLILEIDPLVDDIAKRRKAFYERCGFVANTFKHIHLPYRPGFAGHELIVMSSPSFIISA